MPALGYVTVLASRLAPKPLAARNYRQLKAILDRRGIRLVAVQYPNRPVDPLRSMLDDADDVVFVDNEHIFREALRLLPYDTLFVDDFAGDFGHLTPAGNAILAGNVAQTMRAGLGFGAGRPGRQPPARPRRPR